MIAAAFSPMLPSSYPALVCHALSDDFSGVSIRDLPMQAPAPGEVLIRVRAAALNYPDVLMTQGRYQFKPDLPFVPGLEAAGEVVATGEGVAGLHVGDQVLATTRQGAFAAYLRADATRVRALPVGLSWAQAAAHHAAALTAYVALVVRARLVAGENLLVHGASGGVGMAAVQLGRHLGAHVIATGRSAAKLEIARQAGAHLTLVAGGDLREQVAAATQGRGVDVVFDPVGGDLFEDSLRCLAWGGRMLVVGFVSGRIPQVKTNYLLIKNLAVLGVRAGEFTRRDPQAGAAAIREIDRLASSGVLLPHVSAELELGEAIEGLRLLQAGGVSGKLVLAFQ